MINLEIVEKYEDFMKLESVWNHTLRNSDMDCPFLTHQWMASWLHSYAANAKLYIIILKLSDKIIGIAPLMRREIFYRGIRMNALSLITNSHSNRSGFIIVKGREDEAFRIFIHLFELRQDFDVLYFDYVVVNSSTDQLIQKYLKNYRNNFVKFKSSNSPYIVIDKNWDDYLKSLTKRFRKKIKVSNAQIEDDGRLEMKEYVDISEDDAFSKICKISLKSWKSRENSAIASDESNRMFYFILGEKSSRLKWLHIFILTCNSAPAAFLYTLDYGTKSYLLKTDFDQDYDDIGPGILLFSYVVKKVFKKSQVECDFLGEDDDYKLRWTSNCR